MLPRGEHLQMPQLQKFMGSFFPADKEKRLTNALDPKAQLIFQ